MCPKLKNNITFLPWNGYMYFFWRFMDIWEHRTQTPSSSTDASPKEGGACSSGCEGTCPGVEHFTDHAQGAVTEQPWAIVAHCTYCSEGWKGTPRICFTGKVFWDLKMNLLQQRQVALWILPTVAKSLIKEVRDICESHEIYTSILECVNIFKFD